jgi:hypothetical protein
MSGVGSRVAVTLAAIAATIASMSTGSVARSARPTREYASRSSISECRRSALSIARPT